MEFKSSKVTTESIAKEMSAMLNLNGGYILLGVEDNGDITGLSREFQSVEEWVMNIARQNISPAIIPTFFPVMLSNKQIVGVIELHSESPGKPYKAKRARNWVSFIRVGSTSREATREEEGRLYQASQLVKYETKPLLNTGIESLDFQRVENYFQVIMKLDSLPPKENIDDWQQLLINSDLMVEDIGSERFSVTVAGLLLFGLRPNRNLSQAGVTAVVFPDKEKEYNTIDEEIIRGPLTPMKNTDGDIIERGVIDRSIDFVNRNLPSIAWIDGGIRRIEKALPINAVREAIVNAVTHRDYMMEGTDIQISMYSDRLEVISPGGLPNGVTIEKIKKGIIRVARNGMLKDILRDYGYVEHFGLGVRLRIIRLMMEHNQLEPEFISDEDRFCVCLRFREDRMQR
ncbi:MAG: putative DNA binding domain-containing protein [Bacteroidetes bacterium]|nr:putative DNA binding domain-containing protein [Bacteroidota bacterium]MCY4234297.1 putative DNA binding domain-containing protein [Bacteroidota bacterium]